jgi:hypothetical protein
MTSTSVRSPRSTSWSIEAFVAPASRVRRSAALRPPPRVVGHQRRVDPEHLVELQLLRRAHPIALAPDRQERRAAGRILDDVAIEDPPTTPSPDSPELTSSFDQI